DVRVGRGAGSGVRQRSGVDVQRGRAGVLRFAGVARASACVLDADAEAQRRLLARLTARAGVAGRRARGEARERGGAAIAAAEEGGDAPRAVVPAIAAAAAAAEGGTQAARASAAAEQAEEASEPVGGPAAAAAAAQQAEDRPEVAEARVRAEPAEQSGEARSRTRVDAGVRLACVFHGHGRHAPAGPGG